jgi:rRNA-processing protein FCF1
MTYISDYVNEEQVRELIKQTEDLMGKLSELLMVSVKECVTDCVFDELDHLSVEGVISVTPSIQTLAYTANNINSALMNLNKLYKQICHENK